jgi:transposase-like protein
MIWYIGPESSVYHTREDCPNLNNPYRYWPIHKAKESPAGRWKCKTCERNDKE